MVRLRLGLTVHPPHLRCRNRSMDGKLCGAVLDVFGRHSLLCSHGQQKYRGHNAVARELATICRSVGLEADTEVVVPSLHQYKDSQGRWRLCKSCQDPIPVEADVKEARLDIVAWSASLAHTEHAPAQLRR